MKNRSHDRLNIAFIVLQCLYMGQSCLVAGFAALFLEHRGLDNFAIGLVIASAKLLSFVVISALASYMDRHKEILFRIVRILLIVQAAALILELAAAGSAVSALAFVLISGSYSVMGAFVTNIYTQLLHSGHSVNYGVSRGVGSLSYTLVSTGAGLVMARFTPELVPIGCLLLLLLIMANVSYIRRRCVLCEASRADTPVPPAGSRSLRAFLRDTPGFMLFIVGIFLLYTAYLSFGSFTVNIVSDISGGTGHLGLYNGVCALFEVPFMLFYSGYSKNREDKVFAFCLVFFSVKVLVAALSHSIRVFFLTALLQGISFGIYVPASVDFVRRHCGEADSIKSQATVKLASTLGSVIGLLVTGRLLDKLPLRVVLVVLTVLAALGAAACLCAMRKIRASDKTYAHI